MDTEPKGDAIVVIDDFERGPIEVYENGAVEYPLEPEGAEPIWRPAIPQFVGVVFATETPDYPLHGITLGNIAWDAGCERMLVDVLASSTHEMFEVAADGDEFRHPRIAELRQWLVDQLAPVVFAWTEPDADLVVVDGVDASMETVAAAQLVAFNEHAGSYAKGPLAQPKAVTP